MYMSCRVLSAVEDSLLVSGMIVVKAISKVVAKQEREKKFYLFISFPIPHRCNENSQSFKQGGQQFNLFATQ